MPQLHLDASEIPFPTHDLARAAIAAVRARASACLGDPVERRGRLVMYARAEVDAKERSPRWRAAKAAQFAMKHDDSLLRWAAALAAVMERFPADAAKADADVDRCKGERDRAEAASHEAAARHSQDERSYQTLHARQHQAHEQAKQRVSAAQRALNNTIAGDDEAATEKAATALAKAKKDLEEATSALAHGPMAEVLQAKAQRAAASKAEAEKAVERLAAARDALQAAEEQRVQVDIDRSLVDVTDRIVDAWFRFGRVGNRADGTAPELIVPGADEQRVPLIGSGMEGLLSILYSPNYEALEVDLSKLSDGHEARASGDSLYFDEAATRAANRVEFVPDAPRKPGERGVSVTYTDPTMDPTRGITRVSG